MNIAQFTEKIDQNVCSLPHSTRLHHWTFPPSTNTKAPFVLLLYLLSIAHSISIALKDEFNKNFVVNYHYNLRNTSEQRHFHVRSQRFLRQSTDKSQEKQRPFICFTVTVFQANETLLNQSVVIFFQKVLYIYWQCSWSISAQRIKAEQINSKMQGFLAFSLSLSKFHLLFKTFNSFKTFPTLRYVL